MPIVGVADEMCGIPGNPCCKDLSDPTRPTGYCLSGTCVIDSLHPFPGICVGTGDGGGDGDGGGEWTYPGGGYDDVSKPCLSTILWKDVCDDDTVGLFWDGNESLADSTRPVVLLVHGTRNDCRTWHEYYTFLKEDGFRIAVVNLYPSNHDADAKGCRFGGPMFEPNGKLLNFLIDTLYNFIVNTYPPTWNRDIVMIVHSRASLESEVAIYKYGNRHVKRVISIGGLYFGSKLADVCSSPSDIDLNCWNYIGNDTLFIMCMFIKALMAALNISVGNICASLSTPDIWRMTPEAVITSHRSYIDPYISSRTDVNYYVGIGWTPEWKCGPFSGVSQVGCLILRYLLGQGCNDAVIEYSSSFNRSRYENTCFISTVASSGSPFPWSCGGYPEEWERDHTKSKEDYNIYTSVKSAIFGACPHRFKPEPFDIPITSPKLVGSNAFFAKVDSSISISLSGSTDSILIISDNPINILNTSRIRHISVNGMYGYIVSPQQSGANIMIVNRNNDEPKPHYDGTNIAIFYPSRYVAKVKFDKTIYRRGDRGTIDVIYPLADSVWGLYWRVGNTRSVRFIRFSSVGDTFRAGIDFPFSGVYKFILQTFGKEPRTIIGNIWVVSGYDTESFLSLISNMENGIYDAGHKGSEVKFLTSREYINVGLPGHYKIYDIRGRLVDRGFSGDGKVFVGNLKRGIYFNTNGQKDIQDNKEIKRFLFVSIFAVASLGCKKKGLYEDNPDIRYVKYIGSEGAHHEVVWIKVDNVGNIVTVSKVLPTSTYDSYGIVAMWSPSGNIVWSKKGPHGGLYNYYNNKFVIFGDKYYILDENGNISYYPWIPPNQTGYEYGVVEGDTLVYTYDSAGAYICMKALNFKTYTTLWVSCLSDWKPDISYHETIRHTDGFLSVGYIEGVNDTFIVFKVDSTGRTKWVNKVGINAVIWDGIEAFDGGIVLVGDAGCPVVIKLDSLGNLQWFKKFCNAPNGRNWVFGFNTVSPTSDGKYFAFGYSSTCRCITAAKFDDNGNTPIVREYIWGPYQNAMGSEPTPDGNIVVVGPCRLEGDEYDKTCLIKLDKDGNPVW